MEHSENKLTGEAKKQALEEFKAFLIPQDTSPEARRLYFLTAHPDSERYMKVYESLFPITELTPDMFHADPYSPTPGDPERCHINGFKYADEALVYMYEKVTYVKQRLEKGARFQRSDTLTEDELNTVRREIALQHDREIEKNAAAADRLRDKFDTDPRLFASEDTDLIEKVRGTGASTHERLLLLAQHPEIEAIDDMRLTCFMDYIAYEEALSIYRTERLETLNNESRYIVTQVPTDEQDVRPRDLREVAPEEVKADKKVIAVIYDVEANLVFEAVEKSNWYNFDPTRRFEGSLPHIVDTMNRQPIYTQIYLRVKPKRSTVEEFKEEERSYNFEHLSIWNQGEITTKEL